MNYGDKLETLKDVYQKTKKVPDALKRRPFLYSPLDEYLKAFLALNRRRQAGYAANQPLTTEAILLFGMGSGFGVDMNFYFRAMEEMDGAYLEWAAKKREQEEAVRKAKGKSGTKPATRPARRGRR